MSGKKRSIVRFLVPVAALAAVATVATALSERSVVYSDIQQSGALPVAPQLIHAEATLICQEGAEVTLGSQLTGQIKRVFVKEGDRVRAGDILVELEASEEQAALAEAQAKLAQAEIEVNFQRSRLDRFKQLLRYGNLSKDQFDRSQFDADQAASEAVVAKAAVARLAAELRKTKIMAPFDAVVVRRMTNDQEIVNPGTALLRIADLRRTLVEAQVDELDAARVRVGAKSGVGIEGYPDQLWPGQVVYVAPELGPRTELSNDPAEPDRSQVLKVRIKMLALAPFKLQERLEVAIEPGPDPIAKNGSSF
jgi:multidrug efflux pump subunit AcrA (membrane-fusion protein)